MGHPPDPARTGENLCSEGTFEERPPTCDSLPVLVVRRWPRRWRASEGGSDPLLAYVAHLTKAVFRRVVETSLWDDHWESVGVSGVVQSVGTGERPSVPSGSGVARPCPSSGPGTLTARAEGERTHSLSLRRSTHQVVNLDQALIGGSTYVCTVAGCLVERRKTFTYLSRIQEER